MKHLRITAAANAAMRLNATAMGHQVIRCGVPIAEVLNHQMRWNKGAAASMHTSVWWSFFEEIFSVTRLSL